MTGGQGGPWGQEARGTAPPALCPLSSTSVFNNPHFESFVSLISRCFALRASNSLLCRVHLKTLVNY